MKRPARPRDITITIPVHCRDCAGASDFIGNSCYCKAMGRRTCACERYGRVCRFFVKKIVFTS